MAELIPAVLVAKLGNSRASDDSAYGLIQFERLLPSSDGTTKFWIGVPTPLLPFLASAALSAHPQPNAAGDVPAALSTNVLELGVGAKGEIVLTHILEQGAKLAFVLDKGQAQLLADGLRQVLEQVDGAPPTGPRAS